MRRSRRRVIEATMGAAVLGGLPSTTHALADKKDLVAALRQGADATARIGTLVPPFRPGIGRGVIAHAIVSMLAGELLAHTLPSRASPAWGAAAGAAMGWCNLVVIGRRIPALAELPLGPQIADNIAFGIVFAVVADRPGNRVTYRDQGARSAELSTPRLRSHSIRFVCWVPWAVAASRTVPLP